MCITESKLLPRMALEEKDYATAAKEKLELEEEQRRQRRIREVKAEEWEIKYFNVR